MWEQRKWLHLDWYIGKLWGKEPTDLFWLKFSSILRFPQRKKSTRNSRSEVFLRKGVLKICSRFTGEHPRRSVISIKLLCLNLLCNFIEITLRHGCSPVNLLHIFRTSFTKNTSGLLLLNQIKSEVAFFQVSWKLAILIMLASIIRKNICSRNNFKRICKSQVKSFIENWLDLKILLTVTIWTNKKRVTFSYLYQNLFIRTLNI